MKEWEKWAYFSMIVLLLGVCGSPLFSAESVNQTITYSTTEINEIAVSGNPGALTINFAIPGFEPWNATDATTSYSLTTNGSNKKITGSANSSMPSNLSLVISLAAPTGASSSGWKVLSTSAQDLVTGVSTLAASGLTISYNLTGSVRAGVIASAQKTVTFTLADGS